jgi:hypothetical protein
MIRPSFFRVMLSYEETVLCQEYFYLAFCIAHDNTKMTSTYQYFPNQRSAEHCRSLREKARNECKNISNTENLHVFLEKQETMNYVDIYTYTCVCA